MRDLAILLSAVVSLACSNVAHAIVYNINRTIGGGTITGFLETDGTLGSIDSSNFIDWSLNLNSSNLPDGGLILTSSNSTVHSYISTPTIGLQATSSELSFVFSGIDYAYFYAQHSTFPLETWCLMTTGACAAYGSSTEGLNWYDGSWHGAEVASRSGTVILGTTAVPIPAALPLLASAFGLLGFLRWRRRNA
ncbi:MAG: VPLPA-CTERM sorting domain-containing protein [Salaquimonas sp.]|nr:VPLPA-CTERM sorting domain-containing protein [Salaquimonas sp.]